eukprot:scaffold9128_cov158-Skeletonema_marinoi.AAC.4
MHQICCQMWDTWRMIMVHILFVQGRCHAYQTISVSHPYYWLRRSKLLVMFSIPLSHHPPTPGQTGSGMVGCSLHCFIPASKSSIV